MAIQFEDEGFDLNKAKKIAKTFSVATGVNCVAFSIDTNDFATGHSECVFCLRMQNVSDVRLNCRKIHRYATYQAERFGGKYIFMCPNGLVHFVSPVVVYNQVKCGLLGGPVLMIDHEEYISEEIDKKYSHTKQNRKVLINDLKAIPFLQPERVSELAESLYIFAQYLSVGEEFEKDRVILSQQADISDYISHIKGFDESPPYPVNKEREMLRLIESGDKEGARKSLNEILGHIFFLSGGEFEIIRSRIFELVVLLSRSAMAGGANADMIFGMNYQYMHEINQFTNLEQLTYWLSEVMVRFTDCVFDFRDTPHADVMYKAVDYINTNYMKKITLEDVADYVFLSPTYFSRIFKYDMKCNFSNYLAQVRIEHAKGLLLNDQISLVDISIFSGFVDQSYFSKVFKKIVGMTPKKFRESRGKGLLNERCEINEYIK